MTSDERKRGRRRRTPRQNRQQQRIHYPSLATNYFAGSACIPFLCYCIMCLFTYNNVNVAANPNNVEDFDEYMQQKQYQEAQEEAYRLKLQQHEVSWATIPCESSRLMLLLCSVLISILLVLAFLAFVWSIGMASKYMVWIRSKNVICWRRKIKTISSSCYTGYDR